MIKSSKISPPAPNKVLACGTFDLFHAGHRFFLHQASLLGSELFIILAHPHTTHRLKGKHPLQTLTERQQHIAKLSYITKVYIGSPTDPTLLLKKINPSILALGYDQKLPFPSSKLSLLLPNLKIHRLPAYKPHLYKTTHLTNK